MPSSHRPREYALRGLGYVFLTLCASSLLLPSHTEANLPLFFIPTPNLKNLRGFGAAITLGALGVLLLHQEKVGSPRLTVGALCALSTYLGISAYLGFPFYTLAMAPLGGLALVLYLKRRLCSYPPLPPAVYAVRSYVGLTWGLTTLGLAALAVVDGKAAVRVLRTLKPTQDEGAAFLSAFASLGALATHTSLSHPSAAASVLCASATAAVAYTFVALTHGNASVRANTWYLVGFYMLWAALGMAENLAIKRGARALTAKMEAQALAAATAAFVKKEAAKRKSAGGGGEKGGEGVVGKKEEGSKGEEEEEEELSDEGGGEDGEGLEEEEEEEDENAKKDQ